MKPTRLVAILIAVSSLLAAGLVLAQDAKTTHVVVQDETLAKIATQYFGNAFSWPLIWEANKDKIQDPHFIYPGQELVIPPLSAAGPVNAPDTSRPDTAKAPAPAPVDTAPAVAAAAPEPEPEPEPEQATPQPTVGVRHIGVVVKPLPVVSEAMAFKAGYISPVDEKPLGYIISARTDLVERDHMVTNDKVYIDIGGRDGVKVGDMYAVYRQSEQVKHPVSKKQLGRKIEVVAVIKVDEVEERTAGVKIISCFETLGEKEMIKPYLDVVVPTNLTPLPATKTLEGCIVAFRGPRDLNALNAILYIDRGTADGIMPGDVFEIYRPQGKAGAGDAATLPVIVLGQLQVLTVRNGTAAASVIKETVEDIREGDHIRLIKQVSK
ncbi:MAG TPA: LysM peptidoglycan-binding domain-containing protein [Candidatus Edwardsbacteria bacterium]|nr:LysM peptidoglycan-binding domain-containing protein [Candidatus Edwardsbacteria bacterium]